MSDTTDMMATVKRERKTEALVRDLAVDGLVEWIHSLQDHGEAMEAEVERLTDHLRSRGEHITYLRTDAEVLVARVAELEAALRGLIRMNEEHNAAVETVIGRPLNWSDNYLDDARAALAAKKGQT